MAKAKPSFSFHQASTIGRRKIQEDSGAIKVLDDGNALLMVIADGMGGHEGGEIASGLVVQTFIDCFEFNTVGAIPTRMKLAMLMANEAMAERIRLNANLDGMGTTLVAAHFSDSGLHWISVGDSMLLLYREGKIERLNEDHSMVPVLERRFLAGKITREQADMHPERYDLRSVLTGLYAPDLIDWPQEPLPMKVGDKIVLATDGLQTLTMDEISRVLGGQGSAEADANSLIGAVNTKGAQCQDNATVQVATLSR